MTLTHAERMELDRRIKSRKGPAEESRQARCILLLVEGMKLGWDSHPAEVRRQLHCAVESPFRRGALGRAL
ncbi:hypothetical protein [Nitrospira sp. Nam74]